MPFKLEVDGAIILLVGDFNPKIFQPAWLAARGLIRPEEADAATVAVVHHDLTDFTSGWLSVQVLPERFQASTSETAQIKPLCDLVEGIFTLLEHTPVRAMGINRMSHYKLPNADKYRAFGDMLAPKAVWERHFAEPLLVSQTMTGKRPGKASKFFQLKVERSVKVTPFGVYFQSNEHFEHASDQTEVSSFVERIRADAAESLEFGRRVAEGLLSEAY